MPTDSMASDVPPDRTRTVLFAYTSDRIGGSFISSALLAGYLHGNSRWKARVCLPKHGDNARLFESADVPTDFLGVSQDLLDALKRRRRLRAIGGHAKFFLLARNYLRRSRPDIVHVNDSKSILLWGAAARSCGIPVVYHVRSEATDRLDRLYLWLSDYLIYVARSNRVRFEHASRVPPSTVVYNPVDFREFYPPTDRKEQKRRLGLDPDTLTVGFVGSLSTRKRPEWAVRGCLELLRRGIELQCVIVGEDHKHEYVSKLSDEVERAGFSQRFHFLGLRDDVPDIMRALDVLVLPSEERGEAFPRVVIEAMATRVAVAATAVAGVPEAIEDGVNGLLADPHDVHDFVATLDRLVQDDSLRARLAARAHEDATERYGIARCGDQVVAAYETVCEAKDPT